MLQNYEKLFMKRIKVARIFMDRRRPSPDKGMQFGDHGVWGATEPNAELGFFAGSAAKKWPLLGAAEVRRQGNRKRFAVTPGSVVSSQYA
jgi:hypothetical protein